MSFIYAERIIEYAIRIGTDDFMKDAMLVDLAFFTDAQRNLGADLTPPGGQQTREPLPTDYFQNRLAAIPKVIAETGMNDIFQNSIPAVPDIKKYLSEANIKITHGYPREAQDLPCLAITLGSEDETQYLGTRKGVITQTETKKQYDLIGSDWDSQYQISIITTNYDETIIWYFILKYALTTYRPALEAYGLRQAKLSFSDPEPAPEYLQGGLFVYQRVCTMSCVKAEDIPLPSSGTFSELQFGVGQPDYPQGDGFIIPEPA